MPRRLTRPDPELRNDNVRLVPIAHEDRGDYWALAQEPGVRDFTLVPTRATEDFVPDWLERYVRGWEDGSRAGFTVRGADDDAFLGFGSMVALDLDAREGEIGYALMAAARGRGAASGAVELLTAWGFDALGLLRLELHIDRRNTASEAVAERCGYRLDGVLRSVHFKEGLRCDLGIWSRLATDH